MHQLAGLAACWRTTHHEQIYCAVVGGAPASRKPSKLVHVYTANKRNNYVIELDSERIKQALYELRYPRVAELIQERASFLNHMLRKPLAGAK